MLAVMSISGYQGGSLSQTDIDICMCDIRVFFLNFVISSQSGDDPQEEDLAKSGYKLSMKVKLLKHSSIFWLHTLNMYRRNLAIFLTFFSNYGHWKSKKALDF